LELTTENARIKQVIFGILKLPDFEEEIKEITQICNIRYVPLGSQKCRRMLKFI
jgi:hypothetical protein